MHQQLLFRASACIAMQNALLFKRL